MIATDNELVRRAFAAYFRTGDSLDQPSSTSGVVEHEGLQYVHLHNANRTLAVYRVTNQGQLRRLRRWPKALDE